jgi:transcriptional regulator with XRE-family HTH domain
MGRPERPIPSGWPLARFAGGLRALREKRHLTYRQMAAETHFSVATLSEAAGGRRLPTLPVTLAFVSVCGGSPEEWELLWRQAYALVHGPNGNSHG